jgi:hypothetical protein
VCATFIDTGEVADMEFLSKDCRGFADEAERLKCPENFEGYSRGVETENIQMVRNCMRQKYVTLP